MISSYPSSVVPRADTHLMTGDELAAIRARLLAAAAQAGCGTLLLLDPANIAYASGLVLPYAEQYPFPRAALLLYAGGTLHPTLFLPADWLELPAQQGLDCTVVLVKPSGPDPAESLLAALASQVSGTGSAGAPVGLDLASCAEATLEFLSGALPSKRWVDLTSALIALRMLKTPSEVAMLEEAVRQADRAMVSAINHSEGCVLDALSYSLWEFTERIRVHIGEFGGSTAGHLTTLQGRDMQAYSLAPRGNFVRGNLLRTEATCSHRGYWADTARTLSIGDASQENRQAYQQNLALKKAAEEALLPGTACCEVFSVVQKLASEQGIDLWQGPGIGHGVGRSDREAPYLCADDRTVLQPGMVMVLAVYTHGPQRELICSKDTFVVTESGPRLLSWYRNWDRLYALQGNTARHG